MGGLRLGRRLLEEAQVACRDVQALEFKKRPLKPCGKRCVIHRRYQVQLQATRQALGQDLPRVQQYKPSNYSPWLSMVQSFYTTVLRNPGFREKLHEASIPSTNCSARCRWWRRWSTRRQPKPNRTKACATAANSAASSKGGDGLVQELRSNAAFAFREAPVAGGHSCIYAAPSE